MKQSNWLEKHVEDSSTWKEKQMRKNKEPEREKEVKEKKKKKKKGMTKLRSWFYDSESSDSSEDVDDWINVNQSR